MSTEKQKLAKIRNWCKYRIMGLIFLPLQGLSEWEKSKMAEIKNIVDEIKNNWDSETEKVIKDRCTYFRPCRNKGKHLVARGNGSIDNFCKKHFEQFKKELGDASIRTPTSEKSGDNQLN